MMGQGVGDIMEEHRIDAELWEDSGRCTQAHQDLLCYL